MSGLTITNKSSEAEDGKNYEQMPLNHFDMICNPAFHAFKAGLEEFHKTPTVEIVSQLHTIMLIDNSQKHKQIQKLLTETYPYITRPELYDALALLFCDVAHLNPGICDDMLEFGIFGKLDYGRPITYSLILNICDGNKKAWDLFSSSYMTDEIKLNDKIRLLADQHSI